MVARYHPLLVALHWLLALMILGLLAVGFFVLDEMANADPGKLDILMLHMIGGMTVLALMLVRLIVRWRTQKPPPATTGQPWLDRVAVVVHYGFYVVVTAMVASGFTTAILAGLNRSVFARSGEPLPQSFEDFPSFAVHEKLATLLLIMIALHLGAALYHQFVRKDGLLSRMSFGRRTG